MDDIERLAQQVAAHDERYIGLGSTLRHGHDVDAVAPEDTEELAGDAGRVLHLVAHDGHSAQVACQLGVVHGAGGYLLGKLLVEHPGGPLPVGIGDAETGAGLRGCLGYEEHAHTGIGQGREDAAVDTYYANH